MTSSTGQPGEGAPRGRPQLCVGAVALENGRLLMVRRGRGPAQGRWSIPGGRVENGEMLAEAVVREVLEETGIEVVCDTMLGVIEVFEEGDHFVVIDYRVTPLAAPQPVAGDDAAEAAWVPIEEVPDLDLTNGLAEFLHEHQILPTFT